MLTPRIPDPLGGGPMGMRTPRAGGAFLPPSPFGGPGSNVATALRAREDILRDIGEAAAGSAGQQQLIADLQHVNQFIDQWRTANAGFLSTLPRLNSAYNRAQRSIENYAQLLERLANPAIAQAIPTEIRQAAVAGAYQEMQDAQTALADVQPRGGRLRQWWDQATDVSGSQYRDYRSMQRLGWMVQNAAPGSVGGAIGGAFSVVGAGGQMAGVLGAHIAAFGMAINALNKVINEGVKNLMVLAKAAAVSGGSLREIGRLAGYGVGHEDAAGAGAGFRSRISSPGMGMLFASMYGIQALPRPFGDADEAKPLADMLDKLAQIKDPTEQLIAARELELEGMLQIIRASQEMRDALREAGERMANILTPEEVQMTNDYAASVSRLGTEWKTFTMAFGAQFLEIKTAITNALSGILGFLSNNMQDVMRLLGVAIMAAGAAVALLVNPLLGLGMILGGGALNYIAAKHDPNRQAGDRQQQAQRDNTNAVRDLTYVMQGLRGGGPRAAATIGRGWSGLYMERAMESHSLRLGAFALSS